MTEREAYVALRRIKTQKAPGPDGIPNSILKTFAFELASAIADIYNSSLSEGYLPPLLKSAIVRPLPKTLPPMKIEEDIRPISLTCQVAKLWEGFTLTRILPSILADLDVKQFAVVGKSTEQALVYLLHLILEALDKGNCAVRLFFEDFRKGFDLIDHKILIGKLSKFNLDSSLVRWLACFLQGRSQVTRIDTVSSSSQALCGGIPQGTHLGPILFAYMVNDLMASWGLRIKFVDDLTIMEILPRNSPSVLNFLVNDIQNFANTNNMRLNPTKCKCMTVDFLQYNSYKAPPVVSGGRCYRRGLVVQAFRRQLVQWPFLGDACWPPAEEG